MENNELSADIQQKIQFSGFRDVDEPTMDVITKLVHTSAKKLADNVNEFQELKLRLKVAHKREKSEMYVIHGAFFADGKQHTSEITDRNLPGALKIVLEKIEKLTP